MRTAIAIGGGAVLLIVGVVLFATAKPALDGSVAESRMPGDFSFGADERNYAVALRDGDITDDVVDAVRCVVRRSDSSSKTLRGSDQANPIDSDSTRTVGTFDATTGLTRVSCRYVRALASPPARVFVAPETNSQRTVAAVLIALGVAGIGVGVWPYGRARFSASRGTS
jgi:hypothetical protein